MPTSVRAPCASGCSDSDERARGRRFEVDRVHQPAGADLIAKRHRQPLGVTKQIAAKIENDALLEPCLQITRRDRQRIREQREERGRRRPLRPAASSRSASRRAIARRASGDGCEPSTLSITILSGHGTSSPDSHGNQSRRYGEPSQPRVPAEIRKHAENWMHLVSCHVSLIAGATTMRPLFQRRALRQRISCMP